MTDVRTGCFRREEAPLGSTASWRSSESRLCQRLSVLTSSHVSSSLNEWRDESTSTLPPPLDLSFLIVDLPRKMFSFIYLTCCCINKSAIFADASTFRPSAAGGAVEPFRQRGGLHGPGSSLALAQTVLVLSRALWQASVVTLA